MSDLLKKYGTRVKSIYIELKNYGYYHNPSDINNPDRRFIGRTEMRKKLKNLLTRSETNSGTYLVTGFRGMGKTSFVNQVISEIKSAGTLREFFAILFGFSITMWILTFFSVPYVVGFSVLIIFLLMNVIIKGDEVFKSDSKNKVSNLSNYIKAFYKKYVKIILFPFDNNSGSNNKLVLAEKIIRVLSLALVANIIIIFRTDILKIYSDVGVDIEYKIKFFSYFIVLVFYLFVIAPYYYLRHNTVKNNKEKEVNKPKIYVLVIYALLSFSIFTFLLRWKLLIVSAIIFLSIILYFFKDNIKKVVHSLINNNEIIPVRINLGKEKLSEEDILRLLAFSLSEKYKKVVMPFYYFKRAIWTLTIGFLVYAIALSVYYQNSTHQLINQLKRDVNLEKYFPSQSFYKKNDNEKQIAEYFKEKFKKIDSLKDFSSNESFHKYYQNIFTGNNNELSTLQKVTHSLDYLYSSVFFHFARPFFLKQQYNKYNKNNKRIDILSYSLNENDEIFHYFPFYDYFFTIYIIIFAFISRWIVHLRIWGINHKIIQKRIDDLIENINAVIFEENKQEINLGFGKLFDFLTLPFGFFGKRNKNKQYPAAGAREIEMSLLSILSDIESV